MKNATRKLTPTNIITGIAFAAFALFAYNRLFMVEITNQQYMHLNNEVRAYGCDEATEKFESLMKDQGKIYITQKDNIHSILAGCAKEDTKKKIVNGAKYLH